MNIRNDRLEFLRLRYSPLPRDMYVQRIDSFEIGPGSDVRLKDLAAWNLYWLSFPDLEIALWAGRSAISPETDPLAELAVATARQYVGGMLLAQLATLLPPAALVQLLGCRSTKHLAMRRLLRPTAWLAVMEQRAALSLHAEAGSSLLAHP